MTRDPVFEKLGSGKPGDMHSQKYAAAVIAELRRADTVLFCLNHREPRTGRWKALRRELFRGMLPDGVRFMAPVQIDPPARTAFDNDCFVSP